MELKFTFQNGPRADKSVAFRNAYLVNLGNRDDNDMVLNLPEDTEISPYHAQIRQVDDKVFLQDMGSASGTFLNGQRISRTQLSDGDIIKLGLGGPQFEISLDTSTTVRFTAGTNTAPKMYGQRTVGMMIQQALKSAGNSVNRTTSYFESMLEERLNIRTQKYKIVVAIIFGLLIVLGGLLGFYIYNSNRFPMVHLLSNESDAAERIARQNRHNVFLLAGLPEQEPEDSSNWQGFCTAFAIGPNLLATNAHCVEKARTQYQSVWALMNEAPGNRFQVIKVLRHPGYIPGNISPDVGIMEVSAVLDDWVRMAAKPDLQSLEQGTSIYIYGFPGRLSNLAQPVATFVRGEIGRITNTRQVLGTFNDNILLQHSAVISEGTSGSPMFNLDGNVIGVNAGGYAADGQMMTGYNFGLRIDTIAPLLQSADHATAISQ